MTDIQIKLDPGSTGIAQLERLVKQASNPAGLLKNIGEALLGTTQDRFRSQTDPGGAPWAPLAPKTVERRGSARPILRVRGRLYGSLAYEATGTTLRLGPNVVYAAVHQFGWPEKNIPSREYIGFGKEDEQATTDTVLDWFSLP